MSIYEQLEESLYDSCEAALADYYPDTPIIFTHVNGPELSNPYIAMQIMFVEQMGRTQTSTLADPVYGEDDEIIHYTLNSQAHYEVTVQFSGVGTSAGSMTFDLHHLLNTTLVWEKFQLNNLYPIRKTEVRRAPILRETQWVERYNFDVVFTYSVTTNQVVDTIEFIRFKQEMSKAL